KPRRPWVIAASSRVHRAFFDLAGLANLLCWAGLDAAAGRLEPPADAGPDGRLAERAPSRRGSLARSRGVAPWLCPSRRGALDLSVRAGLVWVSREPSRRDSGRGAERFVSSGARSTGSASSANRLRASSLPA